MISRKTITILLVLMAPFALSLPSNTESTETASLSSANTSSTEIPSLNVTETPKSHENSSSTTTQGGLTNVQRKIQRAIKDISAAFNSTDRTVSKTIERSLLQTSSAIVNNSASEISNTVKFLSMLKTNIVGQMANMSTSFLKQLENSAVAAQSFFVDNQRSLQKSVEQAKTGNSEALNIFTNNIANLTRAIQDGLAEIRQRGGATVKNIQNQISPTNSNGTMRKSIANIFTTFRNRQLNYQDGLSSLQNRVATNFQSTFNNINSGLQDVITRSQAQFRIFMNGLLNLFSVGLNTLLLPFQGNSNSTNTQLRLLPLTK